MPRRFVLSALALFVSACTSTAPPPESIVRAPALGPVEAQIVGQWRMERVLDRGADATDVHNPAGDRYVVLRADGSFESGGEPYGPNTGRWYFDPGYNELTLDSDLGDADDTFWIVTVEGDRMEWAGVRSETARRFRILARRAD